MTHDQSNRDEHDNTQQQYPQPFTAPWFEPRDPSDMNRTWPAVQGVDRAPLPPDPDAYDDISLVPTYRPASFVDEQLLRHQRITPYPQRVGTVHQSLQPARLTVPPPAPQSRPLAHPLAHPLAQHIPGGPPPPLPASIPAPIPTFPIEMAEQRPSDAAIMQELMAQELMAQAGPLVTGPVVRSTPPPASLPTASDPSPIRQRAAHRKTHEPAPRYSPEETERHRMQVARTGWLPGDNRCRYCHAYDRVIRQAPEHPILNFMCMNCQETVYARVRRYTIGERNAMYAAIEKWIARPVRNMLAAHLTGTIPG